MKLFLNAKICFIILFIVSCKHQPEKIIVPIKLPSDLKYIPDSISLENGTAYVSTVPSVLGDSPFSFALVNSNQSSTSIIIDTDSGRIEIKNDLSAGVYYLDISVSNQGGVVEFPSAFIVNVQQAVKPSNLFYGIDTLEVMAGKETVSTIPTINGTMPIIFTLNTNPTTQDISIDAQGKIKVSSSAVEGIYNLNIDAANSAGSTTFTNVLVVNIVSKVVFNSDIKPIMTKYNCSGCHSYSNYSLAKNNVSNILNRVQRTPGSPGFMPSGGTSLSADEINKIKKWQSDGLLEF